MLHPPANKLETVVPPLTVLPLELPPPGAAQGTRIDRLTLSNRVDPRFPSAQTRVQTLHGDGCSTPPLPPTTPPRTHAGGRLHLCARLASP